MGRASKMIAVLAVNLCAVAWGSSASAQEPGSAPPADPGGGSATASGSVAVTGPSAPKITSDDDPKKTILPLVLGGLGAAEIITGLILVAAAPNTPGTCNGDT